MGDIFGFFKQFFDGRKPDENRIPFLHEPIDLKSFPIDEAEVWLSNGGFGAFSDLISSSYQDYYINDKRQNSSELVSFLDSSHSNGWFLKCRQLKFEDIDFKYLAYVLSMKLKNHSYVIQIAELKSIAKSKGVELTTHYYLKPSIKNRFNIGQDQANQLFGNISIEYRTINGTPESFKFLAKSYMDSKFSPPLDFSDLNQILFD